MSRLGGGEQVGGAAGGQAKRRPFRGGRVLEKHSSGMSLESGASTNTRSSGGGERTRGLSRGAVFQKLGQQVELTRKTCTTSVSLTDLKAAPQNPKGHNLYLT